LDESLSELFRGPQVNLASLKVLHFYFRLFFALLQHFINTCLLTSKVVIFDRRSKLKFKQDVLSDRRSNLVGLNDQRLQILALLHDRLLLFCVVLSSFFLLAHFPLALGEFLLKLLFFASCLLHRQLQLPVFSLDQLLRLP